VLAALRVLVLAALRVLVLAASLVLAAPGVPVLAALRVLVRLRRRRGGSSNSPADRRGCARRSGSRGPRMAWTSAIQPVSCGSARRLGLPG
jgi:hypothetical protein